MFQSFLASLARATIRKYKPIVIAVAGSRRTAETRMAVFAVLRNTYYVRTAEPDERYDPISGIVLGVLGFPHQGKNIIAWFWRIATSFVKTHLLTTAYPHVLIFEYPIDRPRRMQQFLDITQPTIGMLTDYDDTADEDVKLKELEILSDALPQNGWCIINHDDYALLNFKQKTRAHPITFGTEPHALVRIQGNTIRTTKDRHGNDLPEGILFTIAYGDKTISCRLHGAIGITHAYAASAAAAVGLVLNMNLVSIVEALHAYIPPPGKSRIIKGIKGSFIIDASADTTPELTGLNLVRMSELPARRKIAVLGDVLGTDELAEQIHRSIGDRVAETADMLVTVGPRAKFIADEAMTRGVEKNGRVLGRDQVFSFVDAKSAGRELDTLIKPGDLILVCGSAHLRLEKIVEEIMAQPERAGELLVRQGGDWKKE